MKCLLSANMRNEKYYCVLLELHALETEKNLNTFYKIKVSKGQS